mgnify:CR=1 FL=1
MPSKPFATICPRSPGRYGRPTSPTSIGPRTRPPTFVISHPVDTPSGRDTMRALMLYGWPGNVRELEHAIEHAFVLVKGNRINVAHLPPEVTGSVPAPAAPAADAANAANILDSAEKQAIESTLARHGWNKAAACRELGLSRTTLWRKIKRYGIDP